MSFHFIELVKFQSGNEPSLYMGKIHVRKIYKIKFKNNEPFYFELFTYQYGSARYIVDHQNIKHVKHENFKSSFASHIKHAIEE